MHLHGVRFRSEQFYRLRQECPKTPVRLTTNKSIHHNLPTNHEHDLPNKTDEFDKSIVSRAISQLCIALSDDKSI